MKTKYSFITPRKKFYIDNFTIFATIFIVIVSIILFFSGLYLDNINKSFKNKLIDYKHKIVALKFNEKEINSQISQYIDIVKQKKRAMQVNQSLKNGLKNFFTLIPDQIKINKIYMTKYQVKIYGYTNNPKTYKLLLEPPLKSIFDKTKVGFTKVSKDKYLFSSYNEIKGIHNE